VEISKNDRLHLMFKGISSQEDWRIIANKETKLRHEGWRIIADKETKLGNCYGGCAKENDSRIIK
jgi:hypothetical protein